MSTIPKDRAKPSHVIAHRLMQQRFNQHRHKFDKHRAKGPAFTARLDKLEEQLFGKPEEE